MPFFDRREAGGELARRLEAYAHQPDVIVLALPRGGVPVAFEVAQALGAPLDVFVVRKLGAPGRPELAMGAVAPGGVWLVNEAVMDGLGISEAEFQRELRQQERELARREQLYRGELRRNAVSGKTVIVVDDGLATGSTMRVAVRALRAQRPRHLVVAVPVAPRSMLLQIEREVDEVVCLIASEEFASVGQWYVDFSQTTDGEVCELLEAAARVHDSVLPPTTERFA